MHMSPLLYSVTHWIDGSQASDGSYWLGAKGSRFIVSYLVPPAEDYQHPEGWMVQTMARQAWLG